MIENFKEIIKFDKKENFKEEELSAKIKEFLNTEKTEFPTFALTSMIMDSFVSGASIFKINNEIKETLPLQEEFEVLN